MSSDFLKIVCIGVYLYTCTKIIFFVGNMIQKILPLVGQDKRSFNLRQTMIKFILQLFCNLF